MLRRGGQILNVVEGGLPFHRGDRDVVGVGVGEGGGGQCDRMVLLCFAC